MTLSDLSTEQLQVRLLVSQLARHKLLTFCHLNTPDPFEPWNVEKSKFSWVKHHQFIASHIEKIATGQLQFLEIETPPRIGKLCADSTPVLTTAGWKTHGELVPGDCVFHPSGEPVTVLAVSQPDIASWSVRLTTGETIKTHGNHEWTVYVKNSDKWATLSTEQLSKYRLNRATPGKRGSGWGIRLPDVQAVQFTERVLPMHPYALGVWLGDGSSAKPCVTHDGKDTVMVKAVESLGYPIRATYVHHQTRVHTTSFAGEKRGVGSPFWQQLKQLRVVNDKHIPECYLTASVSQRLQLLAGLIDTDGTVDKTGRVHITTVMPKLRDSIVRLVQELGMWPCTQTHKPCLSSSGIQGTKDCYTIAFQPCVKIPTTLPRKSINRIVKQQTIGIESITQCDPEPGRCIQVSSPDGLYLVGKTLIPTHNSEMTVRNLVPWLMGKYPDKHWIVITATDGLAQEHGRDVRDNMRGPGYKLTFGHDPRCALVSESLTFLQVKGGGKCLFTGRGGLPAGVGGDGIIVDDFFKSAEEANSVTERDKAWRSYQADCMSRLNSSKAWVLMIGSRKHEDDVQGRLFDPMNVHYDASEAKKWTRIRLPALAEDNDPLGRAKDAPLWPEKFGYEHYHAKRIHASPIVRIDFQTQDQCQPIPEEGNYFKKEWLNTYKQSALPNDRFLRFYGASDHAFRTKQVNDSTVLLSVAIDPSDRIFILPDTEWGQFQTDVLIEKMLDLMLKHRTTMWWAARDAISGSIEPFLRKRMRERGVFRPYDDSISESTDLMQRARSIQARMAMGMVLFPSEWHRWGDMQQQLLGFPSASKDDTVAALAMLGMGLDRMIKGEGASPSNIPEKGSWAWHTYGQKDRNDETSAKTAGWS